MSEDLFIQSNLRKYQVCFTDNFSAELESCVQSPSIVIMDAKVRDFFRARLSFLHSESVVTIEAKEDNKTMDFSQQLLRQLLDKKVKKNYRLIAVGGGITQDITAFTASILFRGVEWLFFPTTLLAQGDSCIGSKTSINFSGFKNLLGNFYPPSAIYIDTFFLDSLAESDIKSGIGEMMHFFLYARSPHANEMMQEYDSLLRERGKLKRYIQASLQIKKDVVERDEFDRGERALFNYGHTFGHALESLTGYAIAHGQAVTIGMDLANYISWKKGLLSQQNFETLHKLLEKNLLRFKFDKKQIDKYITALSRDKKNTGEGLTCILMNDLGHLEKQAIPIDDFLRDTVLIYFKQRMHVK